MSEYTKEEIERIAALIDGALNELEKQKKQKEGLIGVLENIDKDIEMSIFDCFHSLSQPSMQGKTYGQMKDYVTEHVLKATNSIKQKALGEI